MDRSSCFTITYSVSRYRSTRTITRTVTGKFEYAKSVRYGTRYAIHENIEIQISLNFTKKIDYNGTMWDIKFTE